MVAFEQKEDVNPLGRSWRSSFHKMKMFIAQRHITSMQLLMLFTATFILLIMIIRGGSRFRLEIKVKEIERFEFEPPSERKIYSDLRMKNRYEFLTEEETNEAKGVFEERKRTLETFCKLYSEEDTNLESALNNIIIDIEDGISWCPIYKVASSTWMRHFATFAGVLSDPIVDLIKRNTLQLSSVVRQAFPSSLDLKETLKKLNETKKFLIVRHPHERLLSAYRDKLEHIAGREYYYKRFGRRIVHRYRLEEDRNSTRLEPTFTEFLRFIVEERFFDEHWAPFESTCKPCAIRYDYILKLDTLDRDQRFLIQEARLYDYFHGNDDVINKNPDGITARSLVKEYLKDVPTDLVEEVNKVYEKDFQLFSYSPVTYVSVKDNLGEND